MEEKDKISWSYSSYMAALEKEELLNNTDETSFSSLLTPNAGKTEWARSLENLFMPYANNKGTDQPAAQSDLRLCCSLPT